MTTTTTPRRLRRRSAMALAGATAGIAALVAPGASPAGAATQAPAGSDELTTQATLRDKIVEGAYNELNNNSHNKEKPLGSNCNFYSGLLKVGSTNCSSGYRSQAWCADFNKVIWKNAGVRDWQSTNSGARSFYWYGRNNGTWHAGSSGIRPGDTAYYDDNGSPGVGSGHVGVVVYVNGSDVRVVSGNYSNKITKHKLRARSGYQGYTSPRA